MATRYRYPLMFAVGAVLACVADARAQPPAAIVRPALTQALPNIPGHEESTVTVE